MRTKLGKLYVEATGYIKRCEHEDRILTLGKHITTRAEATVFTYARWKYFFDAGYGFADIETSFNIISTTACHLCGGCIGYRDGLWLCGNGYYRLIRAITPGLRLCPVTEFCTALCRQDPDVLTLAYQHVVHEAKAAHLSISEIPT